MTLRMRHAALASCLFLTACAHAPQDSQRATPAQTLALEEVRQAYDAGDYARAAAQVGLSVELQSAPVAIRAEALKLQAYSYCLLKDTHRCERSFTRLLALDSGFELPPNERLHPMWGPSFEKARNAGGVRS